MDDPRDRLAAWMQATGRSQAAVADLIGCAQTFVSALKRKSKRLESLRLARAIEAATFEWDLGPIRAAEWDVDQPLADTDDEDPEAHDLIVDRAATSKECA